MLGSIGYNFRHLFDFAGRDARQTFWYWVLFVVILNIVVSLAISGPMMADAMSAGFAAAQGDDPAMVQTAVMERMAGKVEALVWLSIIVGVVNIVLMAASFVRRLHDSGKSAIWAVLAGAVQVVVLVMALGQIGETQEMLRNAAAARTAQDAFAMQGQMAWRGLLGWVPLIILIVFGVMKSDPGSNGYGEEPVRF